jgi:septal ring factor EnvC (AmiA/AmiB activator)
MSALALALALGLSAAGEVDEERAQLQERLEVERAAFDAIAGEKKSLLTLLDTLERLARSSTERATQLERTAARVNRRVQQARADAEVLQAAVAAQELALRPRLLTLYRVRRRDALGLLLGAGDFVALVKRQRSLKTLVAADVRALDELVELSSWQQRQARRLERLEGSARRYAKALRAEQAVGQARLARFKELLASVSAEESRMSRVVAELERSEQELAAMVSDLASATSASGFRARKGQLPYPADGLVEVGFGKVVNPRFNTVTVQKGIDLRAPEGAEVRSVGAGTVVYAGWLKGYGTLVIVDHGGDYHSLYAHLASSQVEAGTEVEEGEAIGQVGDTGSLKGAYLYFEIRRKGQAVDPLPWLKQSEAP